MREGLTAELAKLPGRGGRTPWCGAFGTPPGGFTCGWPWGTAARCCMLSPCTVSWGSTRVWEDVLHHLSGLGNALHVVEADCNFLLGLILEMFLCQSFINIPRGHSLTQIWVVSPLGQKCPRLILE